MRDKGEWGEASARPCGHHSPVRAPARRPAGRALEGAAKASDSACWRQDHDSVTSFPPLSFLPSLPLNLFLARFEFVLQHHYRLLPPLTPHSQKPILF